MRIKMVVALLMSAFLGVNLMSSCSDEEKAEDPKSYSGWGYFEGTINGQEVSIENEVWKDYINPRPYREEDWDLRVVKGKGICVNFSKDAGLDLMLYRFSKDKRFVLNGVDEYCNNDGITFIRTVPKLMYHVDVYYTPAKNKPFIVDITNVDFSYPATPTPLIEAKLSGVLYREDDPQDSIVIDARLGCR